MDENNEISLGQLCKIAFGRKKLMLIITFVTFIVGMLLVQLVYNRSKETYYTSFDYSVYGLDSGTYIDGSKFNYRNIALLSNLEAVKALDDSFKSIDVEEMYNKGDINIEIKYTEIEATSSYDASFKINVLKKYFKSDKQAKAFIKALSETPLTKTLSISKKATYDTYLTLSKSATVYDDEISYLESQVALLQSKYAALISNYGDATITNERNNGVLISKILAKFNLYFNNNSLSSLHTEVEKNGYVKDYDSYITELELKKYSYEEQISLNNAIILALQNKMDEIKQIFNDSNMQTLELETYNAKIVELTAENKSLEQKISYIEQKIANSKDSTEFDEKINEFYNKISEFTEEYVEVEQQVIEENCVVYYESSKVLEQSGGISQIVAAIVLVIFGLMLSCAVNVCLDFKKLDKERNIFETKENTFDSKDE